MQFYQYLICGNFYRGSFAYLQERKGGTEEERERGTETERLRGMVDLEKKDCVSCEVRRKVWKIEYEGEWSAKGGIQMGK